MYEAALNVSSQNYGRKNSLLLESDEINNYYYGMSCILMLQHPTKMIRNHGQGKEFKLYKSKVVVGTLPKIRNLNNDRELKSVLLQTKMKVI